MYNELYTQFFDQIIHKEFYIKSKVLILNFYNEMNEFEKKLIDKLTNDKEFGKCTEIYEKILLLNCIAYGLAWSFSRENNLFFKELVNSNLSFYDIIGIWTYDGCNEEIIELCIKNFVSDYPMIKKNILNSFSSTINGIIEILEKQKKETEESKELINNIEKS